LLLFVHKKKCFLIDNCGFLHTMIKLIFLMALMPGFALAQQRVVIPEPNGVQLQAKLFLPPGGVTAPGVVALHGCAGPLPRRDDAWAKMLAGQGRAVLLPDSFASRGVTSECKAVVHDVSAYGARRGDALAAAAWLRARGLSPPGGVVLLGWSDGGSTVLATVGPGLPPGLIRGAVALYPACARTAHGRAWRNQVPLLILLGAADDWTPPAACRALVGRSVSLTLTLYKGAYHDFDVPDDPVHVIRGLPYTRDHDGVAHAGEDDEARVLAMAAASAFFGTLPPVAAR
jgi:dienelactone hydrolase